MTRDNVKVTTGPASTLIPPVPAGWLVCPHVSKVHLRCDSPHLEGLISDADEPVGPREAT